MATEVKLPRLGQGMESGTIVQWLKGEGEAVKKREPLYELDTDKVTQEVEAEADGVLLKIIVDSGEVEVGKTIALIGSEGEEVPSENGKGATTEQKEPEPADGADDAAEAEEEPEEEGSPAPDMDDERERGRQAAAATAEAQTASQSPPRTGQAGRTRQGIAARASPGQGARHRHRRSCAAPAPKDASSPRTCSRRRRPLRPLSRSRRPQRLPPRPPQKRKQKCSS